MNKNFVKLAIWLLAFFLGACSSNEHKEPTTFEGVAMVIPYRIQIGDDVSQKEIQEIEKEIAKVFCRVDRIYNNWNEQSEISRLNRYPAHTPFPLSKELYEIFSLIDEIYELSERRFDPTILPLLSLFRNNLAKGSFPKNDAIDEAKSLVGWSYLTFSEHSCMKEKENLQFDLCGIAKGLAIDLIANELERSGYQNYLIDWGGDIRAKGYHPEKRPWKIGTIGFAKNPVIISNGSIASSGSYIFNWQVSGKTYHHIIDVNTKMPLQVKKGSIKGSTCIAPNCALADALATTLMTFSTEEEANTWAAKVMRKNPSISLKVFKE